jgi:hypothetical protein
MSQVMRPYASARKMVSSRSSRSVDAGVAGRADRAGVTAQLMSPDAMPSGGPGGKTHDLRVRVLKRPYLRGLRHGPSDEYDQTPVHSSGGEPGGEPPSTLFIRIRVRPPRLKSV